MKLWRFGYEIELLGERYQLLGALGSGGMADVCLAWDEEEEREVAIKVIKQDQLEQKTLDRFVKEAAQVARWRHANILRIYGGLQLELLDPAQGSIVPYMVMEYAEGGDLFKRMSPGVPYPFDETVHLFAQLCSAVAYAHERGVIHRDLKPLNILFRTVEDGGEQVVLSDFGLAVEMDATHHTFAHGGTLPYMAPEQLQGQAVPESDIFALGVILYQLCTGRLPFRRSLQELQAGEHRLPLRPSALIPVLPAGLDDVIFTALSERPEDRFATALELWEALRAAVVSSTLKRRIRPTNATRPPIARSTQPELPAVRPLVEDNRRQDGRYSARRGDTGRWSTVEAHNALDGSQDLPPPLRLPVQDEPRKEERQLVDRLPREERDSSLPDPYQGLSKQTRPVDTAGDMEKRRITAARIRSVRRAQDVEQDVSTLVRPRNAVNSAREQASATPPRVPKKLPDLPNLPRKRRARLSIIKIIALVVAGALLVSLLFLVPLLSKMGAFSASGIALSGAAADSSITITPNSKIITDTYTIQAITNGPVDPNQRQVKARIVTSQPATQNATINGTGHNQSNGTVARGKVTFSNGSVNSFTVAAGTPLHTTNGIEVITDNAANIPAAVPGVSFGVATVNAHATIPGASGNIAVNAITGNCCTAGNFIAVRNTAPFTGGQDAQNYTFVQQSDVDAFTNQVKASLTTQANNALTGQLQAGEVQTGNAQCPATVMSSDKVGDQGRNVPSLNVTVSVTCKALVYDSNGMRQIVASALQQKATQDAGTGYALLGKILTDVQVQSGQSNTTMLLVDAKGLWVYTFTAARQQQLTALVAGKSASDARALLTTQPGIQAVSIQDIQLPANSQHIHIIIHAVAALQG